MNKLGSLLCSLALMGGIQLPSLAEARSPSRPSSLEVDDDMIKAGFLDSHPDLRYRLLGINETKQGQHAEALRFFLRASYYGDKPSQGMVAEMYWSGQGTSRDAALAYAWMDLAAERGYEGFVILRERFWNGLSPEQRERAIQEGQTIYARYGDAAAQPRLATVLRRERRKMTGSRTGSTGTLQLLIPGPGGYDRIDGSKFYDEKFWDPMQYRAWHDGIWMKPRVGRVTIGEVETVSSGTSPTPSRIPATTPAIESATPDSKAMDPRDDD